MQGVAFVTGGARGIGHATAIAFAQHGVSAVAVVDLLDEEAFERARKDVEKHGATCIKIAADVTSEAAMAHAVQLTVDKFGRIDYAANFAGINVACGAIHDVDVQAFQRVMDVNCLGVLVSIKYELRQMMRQEPDTAGKATAQRGSIVNAASVLSSLAIAGVVNYTASKHAVSALTKTAALEARPHGIRVNAVAPGFLRTAMNQGGKIGSHASEDGEVSQVWAQYELKQGRMAHVEEIASAVVSLSDPTMNFVNGSVLSVDNGFAINAGNDDKILGY